MRKYAITIALLVAVLPRTAMAETKWMLETGIWSKFALGDVGKVVYDGPGQKTSITAKFDNGLFVNVWDWRAYSEGRGANFSEVDYTLGYATAVGDYRVSVSASYYDLPKQFYSYGDVFQGIVTVSRPIVVGAHTFIPYVSLKPTAPLGFKEGLYSEVGITDLFKLSDRISIALGARALHDTGVYGNTPGWNVRADLTGIFKVTPSLDWKIGVQTFVPLSRFEDPMDVHFRGSVFWTGLTVSR